MNRVIGLLVAIFFLYLFSGESGWFSEFFKVKNAVEGFEGNFRTRWQANDGIYVVYLTAVCGVYLLIFPSHAKQILSPKTASTHKPVVTETTWVILGYLLVGLTFGILYVYQNSF